MQPFSNYIKEKIVKYQKEYEIATKKDDDFFVISFLKGVGTEDMHYLEAGSGLGEFPKDISREFSHSKISCIEINSDLVKITENMGFNTQLGKLSKINFQDQSFDVVHCAHVIEHLNYPEIVLSLDEIVRVTKKGGYIIIRGPLMHRNFWDDIDHVRPYPPESILAFFISQQQQKTTSYKIEEIKRKYRRFEFKISILDNSIPIKIVNRIFRMLWCKIRFPFSTRNGFVIILKRIN